MPVLYALSILLLVSSVYAILASQLYAQRSPEHFGRFSLALFSVRALMARPPSPRPDPFRHPHP